MPYAALHDAVDRLACQLAAAGIAPGNAVALSLGNGPPFVVACLGTIAAGAAAAPPNPSYTEQECLPTSAAPAPDREHGV